MRHLTDLRTLTAFVTVAREGSVTRAASILHLTQPAVTLQLKRLSEASGVQLFQRTPHGLELTRDGAALAVKAEQVLDAMDEFGRSARSLAGRVQGKIRVGTIIDPDFTRLGAFLAKLTSLAPGLETELVHGVSGEVLGRLLRDEIDAGYFLGDIAAAGRTMDSALEARVHQVTLARFSYRVVGPPGWDSRIRGKGWKALAQLPWIGTPPASVHNRLLSGIFAEHGVTPNTVAMVDQELSMLAMVRSGVGLSLCRDSLALYEKQTNGIVISDQVDVPTVLSFITRASRRAEPAVALALEAISNVWLEAG